MSEHARPVARAVAEQAARWFLCVQAADPADPVHNACLAWRKAALEHERAWQLAVLFSAQVQAIPRALGSTLQRPSMVSRRAVVKTLGSLVVMGSVGLSLTKTGSLVRWTADLSTDVGERRHVTLADGTQVHLNTDSALDVQYTAVARILTLRRGEVMVVTAADPRPLRLDAAHGSFTPVGTRFVVRQRDDHDWLGVSEGAVLAVSRADTRSFLRVEAGEQAQVHDDKVARVEGQPPTPDWTGGVLRADRMPLGLLVEELGRYRHGWIRCAPELLNMPVSGAFQLRDIDNALQAITLSFPVRLRYLTRFWVSLEPA